MSKYKGYFIVIGGLVIIIALTTLLVAAPSKPGQYDDFASCLDQSGALFYGAFWCPACQDQKARFGRSAGLLPYVECSTPDGRGMLSKCSEIGIKSYPTWEFAGGERVVGVLSLEELSQKTECSLPEVNS